MKLSPVVLTGTFREDYFDDQGTNYGLAFDEEGGVCDYSIVLCSSVREDMKGLYKVMRRTDHGIHDFEGRNCKVTIEEVTDPESAVQVGNWVQWVSNGGVLSGKPRLVSAVGRNCFLSRCDGIIKEESFLIDPPGGKWTLRPRQNTIPQGTFR